MNEAQDTTPSERPSWRSVFNFLFRTDQGVISADVWWRGTLALVAALVLLSFVWDAFNRHNSKTALADRALFDPMIFATYAYLTFYGIMIIVICVSHYNLSAKRLRALNMPPALAGLLPLSALVAGAAHWLQPRMADVMPMWSVGTLDVLFGAVALWSIYKLGIAEAGE